VTQAEIISRVKDRLDETATTSVRYTDEDIETLTLDGARFYVASTGCQNSTFKIVQEARTLLYELPCDFIQVERVLWWKDFSEYVPLEATSTRTMDATVYRWERQTDTRSRAYFIVPPRRIAIWPMVTTDGEEYIVHYQQDVPTLAAVPSEDHEALVDYVLARFLASEGKSKWAAEHYASYAERVTKAKRRMANHDRQWEMSSRG